MRRAAREGSPRRRAACRWTAAAGWILALAATPAAGQRFEILGGWSGTDGQSYGYISPQWSFPAGGGDEWVVRGTVSWLTYDFVDEAGRSTSVRSPGVAAGFAYRWRAPRTVLTLGPGYEVRRVEETRGGLRSERTDHGLTLQGDAHHQATDVVSLGLGAAYLDVNQWLALTGVVRYRLGGPGAAVAGIEATTQGNSDLRATGAGGLLETPIAGGTAFQLRAGMSRLRHASGFEETRPYYSVGVVTRF
jgi:hypothetical protein